MFTTSPPNSRMPNTRQNLPRTSCHDRRSAPQIPTLAGMWSPMSGACRPSISTTVPASTRRIPKISTSTPPTSIITTATAPATSEEIAASAPAPIPSTASPQPPISSTNDSDCTRPTAASAGRARPDQPQQLPRTDPMGQLTPHRGQRDDPGQHARHHAEQHQLHAVREQERRTGLLERVIRPEEPAEPTRYGDLGQSGLHCDQCDGGEHREAQHDRLVVGDGPGGVVEQVGGQPGPQRLRRRVLVQTRCRRPLPASSRMNRPSGPCVSCGETRRCTMITAQLGVTRRSGVCTTWGMGHYP